MLHSWGLLFLFVLLMPAPGAAQQVVATATLQATLAQAQAALAAGDYAQAYAAFDSIETTFGREPEVQQASFRLVVLPLHAYAALLAGEPEKAIRRFDTYLQEFPDDRSRMPFVLFNLARAHQELGDNAQAIDAYRRFTALDPERPEAALTTLAAADLMFSSARPDEGFESLDALIARNPPAIIGNKARLTALQQAIKLGRVEAARSRLLDQAWQVAEMPELAVLAFAALEMGQSLLANQYYTDAVKCYRLIPPYQTLLAAQERRLLETRSVFEARKNSIGLYQGGQFWIQFYQQLIARLEQQLQALQAAEDYTADLYLAMGQAYLLDGRAHEAWILFETLARDKHLPSSKQADAHYRWILAAIEVGVWEDAFRIAEGFGERFPDSPLVPDALYLLATTYQQAGQYRDALDVLNLFLRQHPQHPLAPRVLFVRGYNYNLLNQALQAREDFDSFIRQHSQHGLYLDARYWRALTFFAEFDYSASLAVLDALAPDVRGHRLEPEVAYRRAAIFYAQKDFEAALGSVNDFLREYPNHLRNSEARVLLGDIQMGLGDLTRARQIFAAIDPSAGHLFTYAVFQTGKILRAVAGAEDRAESRDALLEAHLKHFEGYVARDDIPVSSKDRISEALYWIGWTHLEREQPEQARAVFARALETYGDDLGAVQVPNMIDAYVRIEKRISGPASADREAALLDWIREQKQAALADERLTYYARLNFYLADRLKTSDPVQLLHDTAARVPIERLDAEGLGRIAAGLVESAPETAIAYLERLEDEFPDSRHRSYGYFSRAILLLQQERYRSASTELERFRAESPLHPLAQRVNLLYADTLIRTGRHDTATEVLEDLLRQRESRGRPHAEALLALSRNAEAAGQVERAIPYAQRVYNVYRAYPDLAAEAYWISALQFVRIGDPLAAFRTLDEMLGDPRLQSLPIAGQAAAKRAELRAELPPGALNAPAESHAKPANGEEHSS